MPSQKNTRLTPQDKFAQLVLNSPSKPSGEFCGIKFRSSPLLEGSGIAIFGYTDDPNPKNYGILIVDRPKS